MQDFLGRQILIENVSSYLQFAGSQLTEWDFLAALAQESGCGLLLDVNNVYVNAMNHGFDPLAFLKRIPRRAVREMHLAGHSIRASAGARFASTRTTRRSAMKSGRCTRAALERFGPVPTLIEWDSNIPALDVLVAEAHKADRMMEAHHARAA